MIEKQLKDYTGILEDLSKPYGCYGIKTYVGFSEWVDQWLANGGDENCLEGLMMITNKDTHAMSLWVIEEVFTDA